MEKDIRLSDGSLLPIKINMFTLKLIVDLDIEKKFAKLEKLTNQNKDISKVQMDVTSDLIYVILRSNGKRVDKEEALMLVPVDDTTIENILNQFGNRLEAFKKKRESKMKLSQ